MWRPHYAPKLKKRTALLGKLRDMFRRYASQLVGRVIEWINPILRGWMNYSSFPLLVLRFGRADRNEQPGNLGGGQHKLRFRDGTRVHCAESDGCQAEE
jgi:hypothetical protein